MPRLSLGQLPAYRRHKASGQAIVTLDGRDHYLGTWKSAESKNEYRRVTKEWQSGAVAQADSAELTVTELLAAFGRHAQDYYRDAESKGLNREGQNYRTLIGRLRKSYGRTPAAEFGPLRLKAFRQSLVEEGLARTNINLQVNRIRHIFKWGVEHELVHPDVLAKLKAVAGRRYGRCEAKETEPIRPVADAAVEATLPYMAPQVQAMVELQRVTGMRSGEVCIMRTGNISTTAAVWTYTPARHKTLYRGHSRIVFLGPKAQAIVRPWLRTNLDEFLFSPAEAEAWRREKRHAKRKTPLSCGNKPGSNRRRKPRKAAGERYTTASYGKAILYACEVAFGMPAELRKAAKNETSEQRQARQAAGAAWRAANTWHPHQLGHTAATYFRRAHALEVARVLLGHKHAAITETYAEADHGRAVEVMAKIG